LAINNSLLNLFLEQTSVVVKGEKGNPMNWVVTGSQTNQIFRDFVARFMPYVQLRNNQATALNDTGLGAKRDSVMQEYVMANTKMQEQIDNLVKDVSCFSCYSFCFSSYVWIY